MAFTKVYSGCDADLGYERSLGSQSSRGICEYCRPFGIAELARPIDVFTTQQSPVFIPFREVFNSVRNSSTDVSGCQRIM